MNWSELLKSLDDVQFSHLQKQFWEENDRRNVLSADRLPSLTDAEVLLSKESKIEAIKTYRRRVGCSLLVAKSKVDALAK